MVRRAMAGEAVSEEMVGWLRPDGSGRLLRVSCVPDADGEGQVVVAFTDVTEERRLTMQLAHLAEHDPLAGLPDRSVLEPRLEQALARATRERNRVGVRFVDLDRFRAVNDHHGHAVGDSVIVEVAERLRAVTRTGDTAVRIGGDEFVIILDPVNGCDGALSAAHRFRAVLSSPPLRRGVDVIGASMGVALSDDRDTPASLLLRADASLYRAKADPGLSIGLADEFLVGAHAIC